MMPQTFVPFTGTRNDKTKWMNLLLEKVESPRSQRTAVILVSRGVTLLVCGFGQLVFVMPQTFVPFTETRNDKTKWMNLLLEKVESPGSQHTMVILVSRGVTLPDTLFRHVLHHLPINTPPFIPERLSLRYRRACRRFWRSWWSWRSVKASRRFRRKQTMITRFTLACASSCSGRWSTLCSGTPTRRRECLSCTAHGCQRRECDLADRCHPSVLDSDRRTSVDVQSQTLRAAGGVGGGDCRDGTGDESTQHAHGVRCH